MVEPTQAAKVYLHPGEIFVAPENCAVTTILGSCVAVCLWEPASGIGGLNHFLLPSYSGEGAASARFGDIAIKLLIEKLIALGSQKHGLQAKIFGGACVLQAFQRRGDHLGTKNAARARELLADANIPLVSYDLGGCRGRKLIFHTGDGAAWVKEL